MITVETITVTRYRCPHCGASRSKQAAAQAHADRCWKNPAVRGCKTCVFYESGDQLTSGPVGDDYMPETCTRGLLDGATELVTGCPGWKPEFIYA